MKLVNSYFKKEERKKTLELCLCQRCFTFSSEQLCRTSFCETMLLPVAESNLKVKGRK